MCFVGWLLPLPLVESSWQDLEIGSGMSSFYQWTSAQREQCIKGRYSMTIYLPIFCTSLRPYFPLVVICWLTEWWKKPRLEVRALGLLSSDINLLVDCERHQPPPGSGCLTCQSALRFSRNKGCCWANVASSQLPHPKDGNAHCWENRALYDKPEGHCTLPTFRCSITSLSFAQGTKSYQYTQKSSF